MKRCLAMLAGAGCATSAFAAPTATEQCMQRLAPAVAEAPRSFEALGRLRAICHDLLAGEQDLALQAVRNGLFEAQTYQNHVLLYTVVFITLSGVVLAALQLFASYKLAVRGTASLADGGDVSLEPGKVAVRSSVVGVVILALSLGFFAIYVTEVYRLRAVDIGRTGPGVPKGPPATAAAVPKGPPVTKATPTGPAAAPSDGNAAR